MPPTLLKSPIGPVNKMILTPDPILTARKGYSSSFRSESAYLVDENSFSRLVKSVKYFLLQCLSEINSIVDRLHLANLNDLKSCDFLGQLHKQYLDIFLESKGSSSSNVQFKAGLQCLELV